jgi:hypothetical protein
VKDTTSGVMDYGVSFQLVGFLLQPEQQGCRLAMLSLCAHAAWSKLEKLC